MVGVLVFGASFEGGSKLVLDTAPRGWSTPRRLQEEAEAPQALAS